MNRLSEQRDSAPGRRGRYVARFAGDAFGHQDNPADGPFMRNLASEVAWKRPPGADVKAEVST